MFATIEQFTEVLPTAKLVKITPAMASKWLDLNKVNRKFRPHWVSTLAKMMAKGEWEITHQGVAFGLSGNLLDGQHRLMAIEASGVSVEMFVTINLKDDVFKKIDSGLRRSIADRTNLDKKTAETATAIRRLVFPNSADTPELVLQIVNSPILQTHEELLTFCPTAAKYYSSALVRVGACLAIENGSNRDYVFNTYRDLIAMNVIDLSPIAGSLVKHVSLGKVNSHTNRLDALARSFKVFNSRNANINKLIITDSDIKTAQNSLRTLIIDTYGIKD